MKGIRSVHFAAVNYLCERLTNSQTDVIYFETIDDLLLTILTVTVTVTISQLIDSKRVRFWRLDGNFCSFLFAVFLFQFSFSTLDNLIPRLSLLVLLLALPKRQQQEAGWTLNSTFAIDVS